MSAEEKDSKTVCFRISMRKLKLIDKLVELGFYKSRSYFFTVASTDKLEKIFLGQEELFEERLKKLEKKIETFKVLTD